MTALERRCRWVVRLLPPDERAERGEEVVGVLLDLSADRDRPPLSEVAAVVGRAVNLRMRDRARRLGAGVPMLVAALPMVVAPWAAAATVASLVRITGPGPAAGLVAMLGMAALWLVAAGVWLLGYRRTTVALWLVLAAATVAETIRTGARDGLGAAAGNLVEVTLPVLAAAAALVLAAWRGVQAPRPRRAWLLLSLGTAVMWVALVAVEPAWMSVPVRAAAAVVAVLAGVVAVTGRGRYTGVAPAAVVTALIFTGLLPLSLGLFVIIATAGAAISRQAGQDAPSTSLAT